MGMRSSDDPQVGRAYVTEDGLKYYVLSITHDCGQMKLKYLVLSDEDVLPRHRKHMMEVREIGEFVGPSNLMWYDPLVI